MIEQSVMDHQELIKDQQVGTTTAEDSSKTEAVIVVVKSAEADQRGGVEKSEETEFETSKEEEEEEEEEVSSVDNDLKSNLVREEEPEPPQNCVIDVKCVGKLEEEEEEEENCDVEKVCRICHLSTDPPSENSDMIQLGCGCKDELGISHRHCAETWFKLKGNRCCEICGEAAKNITGMWDDRFMEDWNDRRSVGSNSLDTRWGFWRGQPFCNFLMACLVMAFVLPWFFRVNMF